MDEETGNELSAKIAADEIDKRISSLTAELDKEHETLGRDYRFPAILTAGILAIVGGIICLIAIRPFRWEIIFAVVAGIFVVLFSCLWRVSVNKKIAALEQEICELRSEKYRILKSVEKE